MSHRSEVSSDEQSSGNFMKSFKCRKHFRAAVREFAGAALWVGHGHGQPLQVYSNGSGTAGEWVDEGGIGTESDCLKCPLRGFEDQS